MSAASLARASICADGFRFPHLLLHFRFADCIQTESAIAAITARISLAKTIILHRP
jgi:hypothetical protein